MGKEALGGVDLTSQGLCRSSHMAGRNINYFRFRWALGIVCFFVVGLFLGSYFSWIYRSLYHQRSLQILELTLWAAPSSLILLFPAAAPPPPSLIGFSWLVCSVAWKLSPGRKPRNCSSLVYFPSSGTTVMLAVQCQKIIYFVCFSSCLNKKNESSPCYYILA